MDRPSLYSETMTQRRLGGDNAEDLSKVPLLTKGDVIRHPRFAYCHDMGMGRLSPCSALTPSAEAAGLESKISLFSGVETALNTVRGELLGHHNTWLAYEDMLDLVVRHRLRYSNRIVREVDVLPHFRPDFVDAVFAVVKTGWTKEYTCGREPFFMIYDVWARKMSGPHDYDPNGTILVFQQSADPHLYSTGANLVNDPEVVGRVKVDGRENLDAFKV